MTILNSPNPCNRYTIKEIEEGYEFLSDSGLLYFITFTLYPSLNEDLELKFYNFNIDCIIDNPPFDPKVKATVVHILKDFFEKNEDAIITTYDVADHRQNKRRILFDRWYRDENNGLILKKEYSVVTGDKDSYMCLYYASGNPLGREYEKQIEDLKEVLFG